MTLYQHEIAKRLWTLIQDPKVQYAKWYLRQEFNKKYGTVASNGTLFNTNVRLYLERMAAAKDMAVINENGYLFVTSEEEWAYRRAMRIIRTHLTQAMNLGNPGSGLNLLRKASDPLSQNVAKVIDKMMGDAWMIQTMLDLWENEIKVKDAAARKRAMS